VYVYVYGPRCLIQIKWMDGWIRCLYSMSCFVCMLVEQLPRREAQEPVELDVDAVHYFPVRRLRRHCSKHVLWSRHRRLHRSHR